MKKLVIVLILALLSAIHLCAQTDGVITNSTIIKMVKAKLSDELILDEINNSKVNFNVSTDSLVKLSVANVSATVIQAMITAVQKQSPVVTTNVSVAKSSEISVSAIKHSSNQPQATASDSASSLHQTTERKGSLTVNQEVQPQAVKENKIAEKTIVELIEKSTNTLNAISYVNPLQDLAAFYNNQFTSLITFILNRDKLIRQSLANEKDLMDKIDATNKELINKKNENARPFDNEIIALKSKLSGFRQEHNQLKTDIMTNGKMLAEELNNLMKETDNAINEKYKEVSRNVKNTNPDPATADTVKTVNIVQQKFNGTMINHIDPLTVLPACFQNEIIALLDTIVFWNTKALASIHQDAELKKKLEPLDKQLAEFLMTPKQNQKLHKDEISALKKQIEVLNKERKHLTKQMVADSEKLADDLDKMNEEVRSVVKERFEDAIENINYSYQDKF